jgi:hypothetical protein
MTPEEPQTRDLVIREHLEAEFGVGAVRVGGCWLAGVGTVTLVRIAAPYPGDYHYSMTREYLHRQDPNAHINLCFEGSHAFHTI